MTKFWMPSAADLRPLIGRVDRAIKQLIDGGEMALAKGDAEDLTRQLLYYVAQADRQQQAARFALRRTYKLDSPPCRMPPSWNTPRVP